jgi:two-component system nitrate/nitrite response regulator NarL
MKISLLLVDDHPVVREGIRSYFSASPRMEVIGEAANGEEAIAQARQLRPDIVLMDINMPVMNGLEATEQLRARMPSVRVVILTVHDSKEYVSQIARVGAHGYVLKDASPEHLIDAIESVYQGKKFFTPQIAGKLADLVGNSGDGAAESALKPLSEREREVLAWLATGLSNKEIAPKTALSVGSVKTYRRRIMRKLGIHHTAGLTKFALENNLSPRGKKD